MKGHIVIVEDDHDLRESLVQLLRFEGYLSTGASNGAEALELLRTGTVPTLIVLDLMMPVLGGAEFRRKQLDDPELAWIPVILFTAVQDPSRFGEELQAEACLSKPIEVEQFLRALQDVRERTRPNLRAISPWTP